MTSTSSDTSTFATDTISIYSTDVSLNGQYTTDITVTTTDTNQADQTFTLTYYIYCVPSMTWTVLTDIDYDTSVMASAITIPNNLV